MSPTTSWKTGFEIELMAPPGATRKSLADEIASAIQGSVEPEFLHQSELSLVKNKPVFENLTLGFAAKDADGRFFAKFVDDLTLQKDLNQNAPSLPGWYRVVSDDLRLLHLVNRHSQASFNQAKVLEPLAELFGTRVDHPDPQIYRVCDETLMPVAMAMTLPGERHRPCEIVTKPLVGEEVKDNLDLILCLAKSLSFTIPQESATHIHFDGKRLENTRSFVNLVNLLHNYGEILKRIFRVNRSCRRLGAWPKGFVNKVQSRDFLQLPWDLASLRLKEFDLQKYCDFNLRNIVNKIENKLTFEVRIFPGWMDTEPFLFAAYFFERILERACQSERVELTQAKPWNKASLEELCAEIEFEQNRFIDFEFLNLPFKNSSQNMRSREQLAPL